MKVCINIKNSNYAICTGSPRLINGRSRSFIDHTGNICINFLIQGKKILSSKCIFDDYYRYDY